MAAIPTLLSEAQSAQTSDPSLISLEDGEILDPPLTSRVIDALLSNASSELSVAKQVCAEAEFLQDVLPDDLFVRVCNDATLSKQPTRIDQPAGYQAPISQRELNDLHSSTVTLHSKSSATFLEVLIKRDQVGELSRKVDEMALIQERLSTRLADAKSHLRGLCSAADSHVSATVEMTPRTVSITQVNGSLRQRINQRRAANDALQQLRDTEGKLAPGSHNTFFTLPPAGQLGLDPANDSSADYLVIQPSITAILADLKVQLTDHLVEYAVRQVKERHQLSLLDLDELLAKVMENYQRLIMNEIPFLQGGKLADQSFLGDYLMSSPSTPTPHSTLNA